MVSSFIISLHSFLKQDIQVYGSQFVWKEYRPQLGRTNNASGSADSIDRQQSETSIQFVPFQVLYIDDYVFAMKGSFAQKEEYIQFIQLQSCLQICSQPMKIATRQQNGHYPVLSDACSNQLDYIEQTSKFAFILEELNFLQQFLQQLNCQLEISYTFSTQLSQLSQIFSPIYKFVLYNLQIHRFFDLNEKTKLVDLDFVSINEMQNNIYESSLIILNVKDQSGLCINELQFNYDHLSQVIQFILQIQFENAHKIQLLQYLKFEHYQQIHVNIIYQYSKITLTNTHLMLSKIYSFYEKQEQFLDLMIYLHYHANANYMAIRQLNDSELIIQKLEVQSISQIGTTQIIVLSCTNSRSIIDNLLSIQNIIKNQHFVINENFEFKDDISSDILDYVNNNLEMRFSLAIEQKARDLESLFILIKQVFDLISKIPFMFHHLQFMQSNGCVSRDHLGSNDYPTEFNILSPNENGIVNQCLEKWNNFITKNLKQYDKFAISCVKYQMVTVFSDIFKSLQNILINHYICESQEVFNQFKLIDHFSFKIDENVAVNGLYLFVTKLDTYYYYHSNLIPITLKHLNFPQDMYIQKLFPQFFQLVLPNITELVVAQSPIRGLTFIGLRSQDEFLEYKKPVTCSTSMKLIFDIIIDSIKDAIIFNLQQCYQQFLQIFSVINLQCTSDIDSFDPIIFTRLIDFINNNKFQMLHISLQSLLFNEIIKISSQTIDLSEVIAVQTNFYQHLITVILIIKKAFNNSSKSPSFKIKVILYCGEVVKYLEQLNANIITHIKDFQKMISQRKHEYDNDPLLDEQNYLQEINYSKHVQNNIQLQSIVVAVQDAFPFQVFDDIENKILLRMCDDSSVVNVGYWWIGHIPQHCVHYQIELNKYICKMIYGYSQSLPIFLMYFDYRKYYFETMNTLIIMYSEIIMRRYCYIQVTSQSFGNDIVKISNMLLCGYVVVILGVELLPLSFQYELNSLCEILRSKTGKLPGIFSSTISEIQEDVIDVNIENLDIVQSQNIGQIIFFCPIYKSIIASSNNQNISHSVTNQHQQTHQNGVNLSHIYEQIITDAGLQSLNTFKFKIGIDVEIDSHRDSYIKASQEFGILFYHASCCLKQFGNFTPFLYPQDMLLCLSFAQQDKQNIGYFLVFYLIRMLPNFHVSQRLSLQEQIVNFIAFSFEFDSKCSEQLKQFFNQCLQSNFQQLYSNGLITKNPFFTANGCSHDQLDHILNLQTMNSIQRMKSDLLVSPTFAIDLQIISNMLDNFKQPILLNAYQYHYSVKFLNQLSQYMKRQLYWFFHPDQLDEKLQMQAKQNAIFVLYITSLQQFRESLKLFLAFGQFNVYYLTKHNYLFHCSNQPYLIILANPQLTEQIYSNKLNEYFTHSYNLIQDNITLQIINSNLLNQNLFTKSDFENIKFQHYFKYNSENKTIKHKIIEFQKYSLEKKNDIEQKKLDWKLSSFSQLFNAALTVVYSILTQSFGFGSTIEQLQMIKSHIYHQLYRNELFVVNNSQHDNSLQQCSQDLSFSTMYSFINKAQSLVNVNNSGYDTSGLTSSIVFDQNQQHRLESMFSKNIFCQLTEHQFVPQFDSSCQINSIEFNFSQQWIIDYYINQQHLQGYCNLLLIVISASVSAFISFYINNFNPNHSLLSINQVIKVFRQDLSTLDLKEPDTSSSFVILLFICLELDSNIQILEKDFCQKILQLQQPSSFISIETLKHFGGMELLNKRVKTFLFQCFKDVDFNLTDQYQYFWFLNSTIVKLNYEFGCGILSKLTCLNEQEIFENSLSKQDTQMMIQQQSIQQIHCFKTLVFDKERIQFIVFIASQLLTPLTITLKGKRYTGKSYIIKVASLLVRDLVNYRSAQIQNFSSQSEILHLQKSIIQNTQYQLNSSLNSTNIVWKEPGITCLHINSSCAKQNLQLPNFAVQALLKNQLLTIFNCNVEFSEIGVSQIYNTSIILEIDDNYADTLTDSVVNVPLFSETYLLGLCKKIWPNETIEYITDFVRGIRLVQSSLTPIMQNSFCLIERMQENLLYIYNQQNQSTQCLFKEESQFLSLMTDSYDKVLLRPNIISVIMALRNNVDIKYENLQKLLEQLHTLSTINKLSGYVSDSPWKEVKDMIKSFVDFLPKWEQIILEQSLRIKDFVSDQQLETFIPDVSLFANVHFLSPITNQIENSNLSPNFCIDIGKIKYNQNVLALICVFYLMYGQFFDPMIVSRIFEVYISVLYIKERNNSSLQQIFKSNIIDPSKITGLVAGNSKIYQIIEQSSISNDRHLNCENVQNSKTKQIFVGQTLADSFFFQPTKFVVTIDNVQQQNYSQITKIISYLFDSQILEQQVQQKRSKDDSYSESFCTHQDYKNVSKITIDLTQLIYAIEQKESKSSKSPEYLSYLRKFLNDTQNLEKVDFLQIFLMLRIAIALAIGLNPIYVIPSGSLSNGRFGLKFPLHTFVANDSTNDGRNLNTILPQQIGNDDFNEKLTKILVHEGGEFSDEQLLHRYDHNRRTLQKFVCQQQQVIVVGPMSYFNKKSVDQLSILQYLQYSTNSLSLQEGLFSQSEIISICKILSTAWVFPYNINESSIISALSTNLSIIIIDDAPLQYHSKQIEIDQFQYSNTIKQSVFQLVKQIKQIYSKIQAKEDTNISLTNYQSKYERNLLLFQPNQFLNVYKMSGCLLPNDVMLPDGLNFNNYQIKQEFALSLIQVYKWCITHSQQKCMTLAKFSEIASKICNFVFIRCQIFLQEMRIIIQAFQFFKQLMPFKSQPEIISINNLDFTQIVNIIKSNMSHSLQYQENLNSQQQIVIQELIFMRNLYNTIGDYSKPLYNQYIAMLNNAIFDSIGLAAFLVFRINCSITEQQCINGLLSGDLSDSSIDIQQTDPFSSVICAIFKQIGFPVDVGNKQSNRRPIAILASVEWGMFLNNIVQFLARDTPVGFVIKMQNISWKQNDINCKLLHCASIYQQLGYHTYFCNSKLALSLAIMIQAQISQTKENKDENFQLLLELCQSTDTKVQSKVNYYYNSLQRNISIIDLEISTKNLLQIFSKVFESTDNTIVISNCGSDNVNQGNYDIIQKILIAKLQGLLKRRQKFVLGTTQITMFQNITEYGMVLSSVSEENMRKFFKNCCLDVQQSYDQIAILIESSDDINDENETQQAMHNVIIESVFGQQYSTRQMTETRFYDQRLSRIYFQKFSMLSSVLLQYYCQSKIETINTGSKILEEKIDNQLAHILQCENIYDTLANLSVLNTASMDSNKQQFLGQYFTGLNNLQHIVQKLFFDQGNQTHQKFCQMVLNEGQHLASIISSSINILFNVFKDLSKYHIPFQQMLANQLILEIHDRLLNKFQPELKKIIFPILQQQDPEFSYDHQSVVLICVQSYPHYLLQIITMIVVPCILEQLQTLIQESEIQAYQNSIIIMFLVLTGLFSKSIVFDKHQFDSNLQLSRFVIFALWQNQQDCQIMLTMLLVCDHIGNNNQNEEINNYQQLIPSEMILSQDMSRIWIQLMNLQYHNPVIKESMQWFGVHYSSIAALSETSNLFKALLLHYQKVVSKTNIETKQFIESNIFIEDYLAKQDTNDNVQELISQLPPQWSSLNMASLLILFIISMQFDQNNQYYTLTNFVDLLSKQCKLKHPLQQRSQKLSSYCMQQLTLTNNKVLAFCNSEQPSINTNYLSEFFYQLLFLMQQVYINITQLRSEIQYSAQGRNIKIPIPLIFIYYDTNLAVDIILDYVHHLKYNLDQDALLPKLTYKIPNVDEMTKISSVVSLDPRTNGEIYANQLAKLIINKRNGKNKNQVCYPIYLLVPTCIYGNYYNQCSQDGDIIMTDSQYLQFFKALQQLQNLGNPHHLYYRSNHTIMTNFQHFYSLLLFSTFKMNKLNSVELKRIISLKGLGILLFKYSYLSKCSFSSVNDSDFINVIQYIQNKYQLQYSQSTGSDSSITSQYNDQYILSSKQHSIVIRNDQDNFIPIFDKALQNVIMGNNKDLFDIIFAVQVNTRYLKTDEKLDQKCLNPIELQQRQDIFSKILNPDILDQKTCHVPRIAQKSEDSEELQSLRLQNSNLIFSDLSKILQILFPQQFNMEQFDFTTLQHSIQQIFSPQERQFEIKSLDNQRVNFAISNQFLSMTQFDQFITQFVFKLDEILHADDHHVFDTKQKLTNIFFLKKIFNTNESQKDCQEKDTVKMPLQLKIFTRYLPAADRLNYGAFSRQLSPQLLCGHFVPQGLRKLIQTSGIFGQDGFCEKDNCWELSVLTYAPVLGDIFNLLLQTQSVELKLPLSSLRIVVQYEIPQVYQHINSDGSISNDVITDRAKPFYIKLVNFELMNIDFDLKMKTVCEVTPEFTQGFRKGFDLFASIAIIDLQNNISQQIIGQRVPRGMVMVPLRISGFIRPHVLLPNKSQRRDEFWEARNPHFGVRFI